MPAVDWTGVATALDRIFREQRRRYKAQAKRAKRLKAIREQRAREDELRASMRERPSRRVSRKPVKVKRVRRPKRAPKPAPPISIEEARTRGRTALERGDVDTTRPTRKREPGELIR